MRVQACKVLRELGPLCGAQRWAVAEARRKGARRALPLLRRQGRIPRQSPALCCGASVFFDEWPFVQGVAELQKCHIAWGRRRFIVVDWDRTWTRA